MRKKLAILGLVLFIAGTATFGWVLTKQRKERRLVTSYKLKYASEADEYLKQYNEWAQLAPQERARLPWGPNKHGQAKTEIQLRCQQQERLKADMDKLAAGHKDFYPFADVLYGKNWKEELSKYKTQKKQRDLAFTASTTCMLAGATISAGCLLSWTAMLAALGLGHLKTFSIDVFRQYKETGNKWLTRVGAKKDRKTSKQQGQLTKSLKAFINSGWQNFNNSYVDRRDPAPTQIEAVLGTPHGGCEDSNVRCHADRRLSEQECSGSETASSVKSETCPDDSHQSPQRLAVLLSDEESVESENTPNAEKNVCESCDESVGVRQLAASLEASQNDSSVQNIRETDVLDPPDENSLKSGDAASTDDALEDTLENQAEAFEKQIQEIKKMAQKVQQAAVEHSGPINNTLSELTQQVAAIREYASHQQERVKKLQEGYDWNIIKTFCLRVIRCIDNLESRIGRLSEEEIKTPNLEETRDELIFALESSGVERFEPDINSDYRGQQKFAEAVKDKETSDDPNLAGKIAKVIRPGYKYCIDEENVKVVRTAQVKLFG